MSVEAESNFAQLQSRLGGRWEAITTARAKSDAKKKELQSILTEGCTKDTSLVVFGSLARDEFTSGSDIDWTLLVDGPADPNHADESSKIATYVRDVEEKQPGQEGTFGGLTSAHDLIHYIGGSDDTNRNTTQRILLLLESTAVVNQDVYQRVVSKVLSRYVSGDHGLISGSGHYRIPHFLLNDIVRYWRTVAVDFAYKERQRGSKGWALRTAKLKMSRKLTYVAGLLACYSCETGLPVTDEADKSRDYEEHPVVHHLTKYLQQSPLEMVAGELNKYSELNDFARDLFDAYNNFLTVLNDKEKRDHLSLLKREDSSSDETYQHVRGLGHQFQKALTGIFLEQNETVLYTLTKTYGVF